LQTATREENDLREDFAGILMPGTISVVVTATVMIATLVAVTLAAGLMTATSIMEPAISVPVTFIGPSWMLLSVAVEMIDDYGIGNDPTGGSEEIHLVVIPADILVPIPNIILRLSGNEILRRRNDGNPHSTRGTDNVLAHTFDDVDNSFRGLDRNIERTRDGPVGVVVVYGPIVLDMVIQGCGVTFSCDTTSCEQTDSRQRGQAN
jgi:hypothetical protein